MIRSAKLALVPALALALAAPAEAGWFRRCHGRPRPAACPPRCGPAAPATASRSLPFRPAAVLEPRGGPAAHADFLGWLNAARAARGLGPVGWDAGLASDAAANSSLGFGHGYMGRARRQNVGTLGDLATVAAWWAVSPAHASALFDPTITAAGVANVGGVWTYSAN
jgi:uncharacterized protein YkwD